MHRGVERWSLTAGKNDSNVVNAHICGPTDSPAVTSRLGGSVVVCDAGHSVQQFCVVSQQPGWSVPLGTLLKLQLHSLVWRLRRRSAGFLLNWCPETPSNMVIPLSSLSQLHVKGLLVCSAAPGWKPFLVDWLARARAVVSPRSQVSTRGEVSEAESAPFGAIFSNHFVLILIGKNR